MKIAQQDILNKWKLYTLTNKQGMEISFLNLGGIITEIIVPDKDNVMENIVVRYKDYEDYENNSNYFGAITGRVAGRIQDASFSLNDETYTLEANDGTNHLHGGCKGLDQVIWNVDTEQTDEAVYATLSHTSPDGEGGYPGNVDIAVTYTLNNRNELTIDYVASTDQDTALTLTNHSYFNLSGKLKHTIHDHHVTMDSSKFVELDEDLIPTGNILDVENTTFDFREGRKLVDGIKSTAHQNIVATNGYDHYFIFDHQKQDQVVVKDEQSGRTLAIQTNQPGIVMYSGNAISEGLVLDNQASKPYLGVCFETQSSPASLHHEGFPSILLKADEKYEKQTTFTFSTQQN